MEITKDNINEVQRAELLAKAKEMNLQFAPNIQTEKLRELILKAIDPDTTEEVPKVRKLSYREEAMKLVRIILFNNDPSEKDTESVTITVCNDKIPSFSRNIPFNKPWHVEQIILNVIADKEFLVKAVDGKGMYDPEKSYLRKKYTIQLLNPLTEEELKELAEKQKYKEE